MLNLLIALEYFPIIIFLSILLIIAFVMVVLPQMLAITKKNKSKVESYECGFTAFDDARSKFDIRFYLIAMLFIIFDLEIVFLIPWATNFKEITLFGFYSMMFFLLILIVGFVYEWKKGALDWE